MGIFCSFIDNVLLNKFGLFSTIFGLSLLVPLFLTKVCPEVPSRSCYLTCKAFNTYIVSYGVISRLK